jgi:nitrogen fixation NifU-like protein
MSQLEQMYQQVIMDHAKEAHGRGLADPGLIHVGESHQVNTTCGDEVRLRVGLDDGRVQSLTWEGTGCSISQASVSVLHDLVEGETIDNVEQVAEAFKALMQAKGEGLDEHREDLLGDATAFTGVGKYPARIKCALLGWMALQDALIRAGEDKHHD